MPDVSFQSLVVVTQPLSDPPEPLPDVRRTDARSAEIDRPAGVTRDFQVSLYKVEPSEAVLARNLLAKNDCRSALLDEVEPGRPKMPLVSKSCSFACRAERLTRTRSGPDVFIVRPACLAKCVTPYSDTCEEVALCIRFQIRRMDIFNATLIDIAGSDKAGGDQVSKPLCGERIDLVVVSSFHRIYGVRRLRVARCHVATGSGGGPARRGGDGGGDAPCRDRGSDAGDRQRASLKRRRAEARPSFTHRRLQVVFFLTLVVAAVQHRLAGLDEGVELLWL